MKTNPMLSFGTFWQPRWGTIHFQTELQFRFRGEKNETEEQNKLDQDDSEIKQDENDDNDDIEPELVNITRYADPNPLVTRIQMGEECSGTSLIKLKSFFRF